MYLRRKIDDYLTQWKNNENRYPLIIKGARQIGKTESVKHFALSLLPQTVLALDPDQRQAERREGYDVATVSGGHSTYANGGVGGVVGQFGDGSIANSYNYGNVTLGEGLVCNNLGGVIGRDMKKSGSQVENVYYLDSSCAYASTSGAAFRRGGNPRKSVIYWEKSAAPCRGM